MRQASVIVIAAALALGGLPVLAQTPPSAGGGATVEYSADFKVQGYGGPTVRGRVYGAPGRERREVPDAYGGTTLILRYDLGLAWTILPGRPFFGEFPLRPPGAPPPPGGLPPGLTRLEDGDINDVPATKYAFAPMAGGAGGTIWLSREGIALRIDGSPTPGGRETRFELDNLRVGPQPPALFEIPAGYRKLAAPPPAVAQPAQ